MQKKTLEITCYVCGAGAFGVFIRWLQDQLAFDEMGLAKNSVFNFLVPLLVLAAAWMFHRFVSQVESSKLYVPKNFCDALFNPGKLFAVARWTIGMIMCLGAVLLLATSETDVDAEFIRVLCILALLSGIAFPLVLGAANYDEFAHVKLVRFGMMLPILLYAAWLVLCYKQNALNSVVWAYVIEMATIIAAMLAFFRIAGFAFFSVKWQRCLFALMLGAMMYVMSLADERYIGMHIIMFASALMLILYNWILFANLKDRRKANKSVDGTVEPAEEEAAEMPDEGGFERVR